MTKIGKYIFCAICLYNSSISSWGGDNFFQGKTYSDRDIPITTLISFSDRKIRFEENDFDMNTSTVNEYQYRIDDTSGIRFLEYGTEYDKKMIVIGNKYIILLYDSDNDYIYKGYKRFGDTLPDLFGFIDFFSTQSSLKERTKNGIKVYGAENLSISSLPNPWVEGETGDGIGVEINIDLIKEESSTYYLYFSNGYVSYSRPDLYKKNNRVKKIRISDNASDNYIDVTIPDTPDLFKIDINNVIGLKGMTMTILEVYPGTIYNDTCINYIGAFISYDGRTH
ncbi:NADase-type glycan-binding domain-containing protein [Spirochaeta cellobiosiphila]|uniref:NADase-type glycan-binding domain-containing protein n=1 Tax=Spirochaeta cellobiosiphila TaxID=504483 RepID=UPI00040F6778|nr:hypothetical protein [Spirochaeta cellobiosiphila]